MTQYILLSASSDQKSRSQVVRKGEYSPEEKAKQVHGIFQVMKPCNHVLEVLHIIILHHCAGLCPRA